MFIYFQLFKWGMNFIKEAKFSIVALLNIATKPKSGLVKEARKKTDGSSQHRIDIQESQYTLDLFAFDWLYLVQLAKDSHT